LAEEGRGRVSQSQFRLVSLPNILQIREDDVMNYLILPPYELHAGESLVTLTTHPTPTSSTPFRRGAKNEKE